MVQEIKDTVKNQWKQDEDRWSSQKCIVAVQELSLPDPRLKYYCMVNTLGHDHSPKPFLHCSFCLKTFVQGTIYKHRDQRLETMVVTQCVNAVGVLGIGGVFISSLKAILFSCTFLLLVKQLYHIQPMSAGSPARSQCSASAVHWQCPCSAVLQCTARHLNCICCNYTAALQCGCSML